MTRRERTRARIEARGSVWASGILLFAWVLFWTYSVSDAQARIAEHLEMKALCEKDSGIHIYEEVSNVEGYAYFPENDEPSIDKIATGQIHDVDEIGDCFPCFSELIYDGYAYIESYYIAVEDRAPSRFAQMLGLAPARNYYASKTGLYRYRLVNRYDDPELCVAFDRVRLEAMGAARRKSPNDTAFLKIFDREYPGIRQLQADQCIYAEPIQKFSAPYSIHRTRDVVSTSERDGQLVRIFRTSRTFSSRTGRVVAEAVSYGLVIGEAPFTPDAENCGLSAVPANQILVPNGEKLKAPKL